MKRIWVLLLTLLAGVAVPAVARAQDKKFESATPTPLEKQLYAVEIKWMKAEHDKIMDGPDSMNEMWTDSFFDVLSSGIVVDKHQMMDMMNKADAKPGT